jgi:hypothetical protein
VWQPALRDIWNCDLAIVGQENRFLINYLAQATRGLWRSKLALWGHGRNFQLDDTRQWAVQWQQFWVNTLRLVVRLHRANVKRIVEGYGFSAERITVFHNSIDTSDRQRLAAESPENEYLLAGGHGFIVNDWRSVRAYAEAVVSVLQDACLRARLCEAGRAIAKRYTLDRMVDSFCEGVSQALAN